MISISEALKIIENQVGRLATEKVSLDAATGRVLAEDVFSDADLPAFDRSQMDGFAVKTEDLRAASGENPVKLLIIGESVAGNGFDGELQSGEAVRIMTGARLPRGADAVQKKEVAREIDAGRAVEIFEPTKPGQNFTPIATEIKKDSRVFSAGEVITAQMVAGLASFGYSEPKVFRQPTVSVLSTGSEIVTSAEKPAKDQIRDSNSPTLSALARQAGAIAETLPLIKDDFESLKSKIAEIAGLNADSKLKTQNSKLLIISGGVSVGDYDFTKPALAALGAEIFFEKVALKPGKPAVFARLGETFVFGLPGNPVSAAVTFYLFVRKAILQMQGASDCDLPRGFARVSKTVKGAKGRDAFLPAKIIFDEKARISAEPLKWSGSADFIGFARADCLIFVPQDEKAEAGDIAQIVLLPK